ncbi:DUF1592 domain-containing protein [Aureliella helgolandensis]|uniref:Cytochrome c domain-containing protein n=1 Tax=Aureliella helgolandensis TaxID=2527968 RepID=A0A518FZX3_9BACT|nr:DUF1592 domain-containing protein [Aureliella helgolandensis]QDV21908.1 hypothetical protein Q31a_01870 [Aureliella helgolandensis]
MRHAETPSIESFHPTEILLCAVLVVSWLNLPSSNVFAVESNAFSQVLAPAIREHCSNCHGAGEDSEGGLDLLEMNTDSLGERVELVRSLIRVLDLQEMPPEAEPPLDSELRQSLVTGLTAVLHASLTKQPRFSHTPMRRMNRFQYNNAVTDLFGLKCIVFTLPERMMREHNGYFKPESGKMADVVSVGSRPLGKSQLIEPRLANVAAFPQDLRAEHGFDNRGDHLSMSPLLMESFLALGQSITQSPDFDSKNVGIWDEFFAVPTDLETIPTEVRRRLKPFLTKAFRRPIVEEQFERYASYVLRRLDAGTPFTEAMQAVAAAAIASPRFLYLYETSHERGTVEEVDDFELASRLSFFLWGSLPDQSLLDLAAAGTLSRPDILDLQIERMLKDHKLKRFCDSFPTQWLQLDRIISSIPSRERFPQFYYLKYRDSMHMMLEPLLLFETVLIENQSITQLIDSDFTYRSTLLEEAYRPTNGKPQPGKGGEVMALRFRRMPVTDRRDGGVITNAAVMTMTSGPERTQPITRGAWIASVIFNNPPDPPPADVPALDETPPAGEESLTLRERLSMHRQRSDCKGCHEQIDPLGFALENYDPIGVWRETYENGREVDMAGRLFQKHEFVNVLEFKDAILAEKDRFALAFGEHLLSFALARELEAADHLAAEHIATTCAQDGYKMQTFLKQVILSKPFRSKCTPLTSPRHASGQEP